jgi:sulfopropanediol 3-dehydrogenase
MKRIGIGDVMVQYLKKATHSAENDTRHIRGQVRDILRDIETRREAAALEYAAKFDRSSNSVPLTEDTIARAADLVPEQVKADIHFAHDNVRRFAEMQKQTIHNVDMEILPGLTAGQRAIPINTVGCYIPGGRYNHIASAIMTVTTAKVAGCRHIIACTPPNGVDGPAPAIIYAAKLCGADTILAIGGVQGIAAMTFGLFEQPAADLLVGPGNQYVAEAKRILYGRVGIDMVAGPTDSLILADRTADPLIVATDLVSQAEHGYNSPVWLVTDDRQLAYEVMRHVPQLISDLPPLNQMNAEAAWRDYAEVVLCSNREEMARISDSYAPEHLTVQAADLEWWLDRLTCYGALFLGEETTVSFGDKAAGTNHVLPTSGAATYTGGLSVHKFMKIVTWQQATREGARPVAEATARISRLEGMEGHARAADVRLAKYFPEEAFDLSTKTRVGHQ